MRVHAVTWSMYRESDGHGHHVMVIHNFLVVGDIQSVESPYWNAYRYNSPEEAQTVAVKVTADWEEQGSKVTVLPRSFLLRSVALSGLEQWLSPMSQQGLRSLFYDSLERGEPLEET